MKSKNLMLLISSVCFSLIISEVGLRLFTIFPIHTQKANRINDDRLGYRINPSLSDIDRNGFRNKNVAEKVDIVALGDSHTFGVNVDSEDAWPQQLAHMTNKTVYNFGVSGYGSLQYYYLIDEAVKLKPEHIILGLYLANDLNDTCELIDKIVFWQKWAKERGYNIEACLKLKQSDASILDRIGSALTETAIGSLIAYSIQKPLSLARIRIIKDTSNAVIIDEEMNKTIIEHRIISRHERYTDLNQPDIALSYEITKDIISEAKKKSDLNNIQFSVIFIPSKENVFFDYLTEKDYQLPTNYHELVAHERNLVDRFSAFFEQIGVKSVDARPYVVKELYKSGNIYPISDEGHPLKIGYRAYAKAAYDAIFNLNR